MKYVVQETISYHVEAESEEEAIQHVIDDGERDKHCFYGVGDREAWELVE